MSDPVQIGALAMHAGCTTCDGNGTVVEHHGGAAYETYQCESLVQAEDYVRQVLTALHADRWRLMRSETPHTATVYNPSDYLLIEEEWKPEVIDLESEHGAICAGEHPSGSPCPMPEASDPFTAGVLASGDANDQRINYMRNTPHAAMPGTTGDGHGINQCTRCYLPVGHRIHERADYDNRKEFLCGQGALPTPEDG